MTSSGKFIVVLRASGGAAPVYWGPGTEDEAKAALAALEEAQPAPEGVTFEWGIAELQSPPAPIETDPTGGWLAWEQFGRDSEEMSFTYFGPMTQGQAEACNQELHEQPEPASGWREAGGVAYEMQAFPA